LIPEKGDSMRAQEMEIKGNGHYRDILFFWELTKKEQDEIKDDYEDIQESSFFRFKGRVYDLNDFMRIDSNHMDFAGYHGYHADSFFSGILVKMSECGEGVSVYQYFL
jgi:hypothetical protein